MLQFRFPSASDKRYSLGIANTMSAAAWPEIQTTKLDAARRQLETAIALLFAGGDAISTHTLA